MTGGVLGLVMLLELVVFPMWDQRTVLSGKIQAAKADVQKSTNLIELSERSNRNWATVAGSVRKDASEAESQVLHNVRDWANETGINLASIKPERNEKEKDFQKLIFRATGTGSMAQVGRFLHRIQTASMPIRITDLTISSRKDGVDDLSLSVAIATIYVAPEADKSGRPVGSASAGEVVR